MFVDDDVEKRWRNVRKQVGKGGVDENEGQGIEDGGRPEMLCGLETVAARNRARGGGDGKVEVVFGEMSRDGIKNRSIRGMAHVRCLRLSQGGQTDVVWKIIE